MTKHISFPVNIYLARILNSKLFPNLGVLSVLYFLIVFVISFISWMPVGTITIMVLGTLLHLLEEGGIAIQEYAAQNELVQKLYSLFLISALILIESSFCLLIVKRFNGLRNEKVSPNILKIITLVATAISYLLFIFMIRDWWFIN